MACKRAAQAGSPFLCPHTRWGSFWAGTDSRTLESRANFTIFEAVENKLISKKKVPFPVTPMLQRYLQKHDRSVDIPVAYDDLLRFEGSLPILDTEDRDTLWIDCIYSNSDREELVLNLKRLYSILHADGSDTILPFITVDSIAFCTFGNTKPFRVKVRNIINDNYVFLYVK